MINKNNGNSILTTPIIIAVGIFAVSILISVSVNILMPYIWYEKLSSECIKYVFAMEEYGYLTKYEATNLKEELVRQGFDEEGLKISYTTSRVDYGEKIYLKIEYDYNMKLLIIGDKIIAMNIEKNSVSKR